MGTENDDQPNMEVVCATAGFAIKAGLSMTVDGETIQLPNRGWAPPPATGAPEVEYGAALAVQAIVYAFDLDPQQVERVSQGLLSKAGI